MSSPLDAQHVSRKQFIGRSARTLSGLTLVGGLGIPSALAARRRGVVVGGIRLPDPRRIGVSDATRLTVLEAAALLRAGRLSSVELLDAHLERIHRYNGPLHAPGEFPAGSHLNAFVRLYEEPALRAAGAADRRLAAPGAPLLTGIPMGLKDMQGAKGYGLTASSRVIAHNVALVDSTVWQRLRGHGAILLGHTTEQEFSGGAYTQQSRNPWDHRYTPGGSSGGSGIAVAARFLPVAMGTDTAGSTRIPASIDGVSALKQTFGLVSLYGCLRAASSFMHNAPMGRSAADVAALLSLIAGRDPRDPFTAKAPTHPGVYPVQARPGPRPLAGVRLGIPDPMYHADVQPGIAKRWEEMQATLTHLGAQLVPVPAPTGAYGGNLLTSARENTWGLATEFLHYHKAMGWWPRSKHKYSIRMQQLLTAADGGDFRVYDKSDQRTFSDALLHAFDRPASPGDVATITAERARRRTAWVEAMDQAGVAAMIEPTLAYEPVTQTESSIPILAGAGDTSMGVNTQEWNTVGFPAGSIPMGRSHITGLPTGLQIVGQPFHDATVLQVMLEIQAHTGFHHELPVVHM
jgi:aspartyl-tRNA(Asn)/glutamyl-tRNA(Gln) amidotransferase subunit A